MFDVQLFNDDEMERAMGRLKRGKGGKMEGGLFNGNQ